MAESCPLPLPCEKNGAETQIRTGDTSLFRAVLYRLSYLGTKTGGADRI